MAPAILKPLLTSVERLRIDRLTSKYANSSDDADDSSTSSGCSVG